MSKTKQELIEISNDSCSHVVILGAGASRAAFPKGDAKGFYLPVMDDLIDVIGLTPLIEKLPSEITSNKNFEHIYSTLVTKSEYSHITKQIEDNIDGYFSNLSLPNHATIYDRLLISLRPGDAIFTFNWDPFLFDAYQRNRHIISLPEIFFLHGNVRIGKCLKHEKWGARGQKCPICSELLVDVPLLYPIENKNYSANTYINDAWQAAKILLKNAFTLTIFGYGASISDKDAVELLRLAWINRSSRTMEHIQIIDKADTSVLHNRWSPFTPTNHYTIKRKFEQSRLARWPRRSCESIFYPMIQGMPCEDFPLPTSNSLPEIQAFAKKIAQYENASRIKGG